MGEAYILRRGSGGIPGNWAVIVARVPANSTVTATKDGITLTPKMWVTEADPGKDIALFALTPAQFDADTPWTVTATDGGSSASETVLVTSNKEYEIELSYRITQDYQEVEYLEKRGNKVIIDTGIMCTRNSYVLVNYYMIDYSSSVATQFFGAIYDGNYRLALQSHSNNARIWAYNAGISLNSGVAENRLQKWTKVRYQDGTKIEILDENDTVLSTATGVAQADPLYSISIFAMHTSATGYNSSDGNGMRLGIIWLDDNELIPCYRKSDSAPGYFNAKTKEFKGNTGTGTIYLGPDL